MISRRHIGLSRKILIIHIQGKKMAKKILHYQIGYMKEYACGRKYNNSFLTTNINKVTCKRCLITLNLIKQDAIKQRDNEVNEAIEKHIKDVKIQLPEGNMIRRSVELEMTILLKELNLNSHSCSDVNKMVKDHSNVSVENNLNLHSKQDILCKECGHKLSLHIDEGDRLRCHSIATDDGFQCECKLQNFQKDIENHKQATKKFQDVVNNLK